jgi:hypothetical protein
VICRGQFRGRGRWGNGKSAGSDAALIASELHQAMWKRKWKKGCVATGKTRSIDYLLLVAPAYARRGTGSSSSSSTGARPRSRLTFFDELSFQARLTDSPPAQRGTGQLHAWTLLHEEVQQHKACQDSSPRGSLSQISRGRAPF